MPVLSIVTTLQILPTKIPLSPIEALPSINRLIIEAFEAHGFKVNDLILTGGIPKKNRLLVQIYSDVTGREIRLGGSPQAAALGAAMHAAVAAGVHPDITRAAAIMRKLGQDVG